MSEHPEHADRAERTDLTLRIVLADAEAQSGPALDAALDRLDYVLRVVRTGQALRAVVDTGWPDLVILDLVFPDVSGLVLCGQLRAQSAVPIVVWSAGRRRDDLMVARLLGADDVIAKSVAGHELEARIAAVLRRAPRPHPSAGPRDVLELAYRPDTLVIDRQQRQVRLGGRAIPLTQTEFRLLTTLATAPGKAFSRHELAESVWGYRAAAVGRTIDAHILRLRRKLTGGAAPAPLIIALSGYGYKLADPGDPQPPEQRGPLPE